MSIIHKKQVKTVKRHKENEDFNQQPKLNKSFESKLETTHHLPWCFYNFIPLPQTNIYQANFLMKENLTKKDKKK